MINIKITEEQTFAHYGVSVKDGAPGRGSGRYPLGSGERPRSENNITSAKRGGRYHGDSLSNKETMVNRMADMSSEQKVSHLSDMTKALEDGRIGSPGARRQVTITARIRKDMMKRFMKSIGSDKNDMVEDFVIPRGKSVYRVADVGDDKLEGRKYVCCESEALKEYAPCYSNGELGSHTETDGRIFKISPKDDIKIAGYNKTAQIYADILFGDKTFGDLADNTLRDWERDDLSASDLYKKLACLSPANELQRKSDSLKKVWLSSYKNEYDIIKDIKARDAAKFLYGKDGFGYHNYKALKKDSFDQEDNNDVYSLFNMNTVMLNLFNKEINRAIYHDTKKYDQIAKRLQDEGYSGMIDLEDACTAATPMILFDTRKSGVEIRALTNKDGSEIVVEKKEQQA